MARRWKIALGLALALFALRAALPTIVTHVIEGQASSALGRTVEVENVDLSLLTGGIALEELLVGPPLDPGAPPAAIDPETALIRWPHSRVDVGWLGLLSGELRIQQVTVRGARERLVLQADDRLEPLVVARPEDSRPPFRAPESEETDEAPPADAGAEEKGGWPLRIEQLALEDHAFLLIDAADAARPPIELTLAELTVGDVVLAGGQVSVGPVGLRSPRLRVRRDLQVATAPAQESATAGALPQSEAPEANKTRLGFRLASFIVEDAQLGLLLDEGQFDVAMSLSVRNATLEQNARFPVELRLTRQDGWLEVTGDLGLAPIGFAGTVRWEDFPVVGLIAAADPEIPLAGHAGSVAGELTVDLGSAEPGRLSLRGRVAARQIGLRHDEEVLKLDCEAFELVVDEIEIPLQSDEPPKVSLASVRIEKPAIKLVRRASAAEVENEEPAPPSGAPRIDVGKLEVVGGTLQLIDESVEPTATTSLSKIRLAGSGLQFPARSGQLETEFRSIDGTSLQVAGSWQEGDGTTTVALQKIQLPGYSPYLSQTAGFEFTRGTLSVDGKIQSAGPKHDVKADLTFAKPALRDVKEGAFKKTFGMSAPTAVSLLTGPRGNIVLPLGLTLDEVEGGVNVGSLLTGAFRQSLAAVVAAPIKGLGLALRVGTAGRAGGQGGLGLDPVELEPGSAELTPDQIEHARLVAEGLSARPDIGLALEGRYAKEDEPFLRAQALLERIDAGELAPYDERGFRERRRLRRGLERRAQLQPDDLEPSDAALIEEWLTDVDVPREKRDGLALARADAVRSVLVDDYGLDAAQVRIAKPRKGPPGVAIELFVTARREVPVGAAPPQ